MTISKRILGSPSSVPLITQELVIALSQAGPIQFDELFTIVFKALKRKTGGWASAEVLKALSHNRLLELVMNGKVEKCGEIFTLLSGSGETALRVGAKPGRQAIMSWQTRMRPLLNLWEDARILRTMIISFIHAVVHRRGPVFLRGFKNIAVQGRFEPSITIFDDHGVMGPSHCVALQKSQNRKLLKLHGDMPLMLHP